MFKNVRLGVKIGFGFAMLLLIACSLGGMAIWSMNGVGVDAGDLSQMYMPQAVVATDVERYSLHTMYSARGYAYTAQKTFLDDANANLAKINGFLQDAQSLSDKHPELVGLKESVAKVKPLVAEYTSRLNETVELNAQLDKERANMILAGDSFMKTASDYLSGEKELIMRLVRSQASTDDIQLEVDKTYAANDIIDMVNLIRRTSWEMAASRDPAIFENGLKSFDNIRKILSDMASWKIDDLDRKFIEGIKKEGDAYEAAARAFIDSWKKMEDLNTLRNKIATQVLDSAQSVSAKGVGDAVAISNKSVDSLSNASTVMIIGLIVAVIIGFTLAIVIIMSITRPVNRISQVLSEGAHQVASASGQLSGASQQLAEGTSELASSIEETSATLQQSASMIQQNNENTKQAAMLSRQAKDSADRGNMQMGEMMASMTELKKSSDQIAKIIKVIDEIAFQTNILALNAAVEAARAGEAGMGFAVVAEEVRNLAQRSAQAAKDTASIIETNIALSNQGVETAGKVQDALGEITKQSQKVSDLVDEITAASQEQAQGITQINKAINQMEQVTQNTASNAEETASASEELMAQSESMRDAVNELVRLVHGAHADTEGRRSLSAPAQQIRRAAITEKKTDKPIARLKPASNGNAKKTAGRTGKTNVVSPEDVIPLEDDSQDF